MIKLQFIFLSLVIALSLEAGLIPKDIYKSIENKVKEKIGMEVPDYDEYKPEEKTEITPTPEKREELIKEQFVKKEEIIKEGEFEKEKINVEEEATQFFNTLNNKNKKPLDLE